MSVYAAYLKYKDIWDSIFILLNIIFCFLIIGLLAIFIKKNIEINPKLNELDIDSEPESNCQFNKITYNPFFNNSFVINIMLGDTGSSIFIVQSGYTITRYAENINFNGYLSYNITVASSENSNDIYDAYVYTSKIFINQTSWANFYHTIVGVFAPTTCIEDYIISYFQGFLQQTFSNDVFNTEYRPFLPVFGQHFNDSFNLETCDPKVNEYIYNDTLWSNFVTDFSTIIHKHYILRTRISYICDEIEIETTNDYFLRLAAYSFIATLILLFLQFIINLIIAVRYDEEIKKEKEQRKKSGKSRKRDSYT